MTELKTKEITLDHPIVIDGKETTTVTMREAIVNDHIEAADMAGPNAGNARYEACLMAHLTDIPFGVFIGIHEHDYFNLVDEYRALGKSQSPLKSSDKPV